jgi:LacI family transcriptional regulator
MDQVSNTKTLKSLADQMGLSATTVSRVLSGKAKNYRIGQKTEQAVIAEAARLNISPNQIAKSLRLQRTKTLGLIVPNIANPFFGTLARHIELEARKRGYFILLCDSGQSEVAESESLRLLSARNVDGIIAAPLGGECTHFKQMHKSGKPMIVVDRYFSDMSMPCVTSDNYKASLEGMEYLIENGHRNIACIQGLPSSAISADRLRGYKDGLAKFNIPLDETLIVGDDFDQQRGYIETKLLLKRATKPSAIFSLGSSMAFGALMAIVEEGLKVPDDISLMAFDEQPYFAFLDPPLTAIAQQNAAMGEIAVKIILDQIEGKCNYGEKRVLLPTKLNIRKSVKRLT